VEKGFLGTAFGQEVRTYKSSNSGNPLELSYSKPSLKSGEAASK